MPLLLEDFDAPRDRVTVIREIAESHRHWAHVLCWELPEPTLAQMHSDLAVLYDRLAAKVAKDGRRA